MSAAPCVLLPYAATQGVCDRCGRDLVGRQRRWCSRVCSAANERQHHWPLARKAALTRDGSRCTQLLEDGARCPVRIGLEVNHIVPLVGAGYGWSCAHHVDGLEVCCHTHHVAITNAQAAERRRRA